MRGRHRAKGRGLFISAVLTLLGALPAGAGDSLRSETIACLDQAGYRTVLLTRSASGAALAIATLDSFTVRVLVDAAAPYTLFDGEALRRLGYSPDTTGRSASFGGAPQPLYRISASSFALGAMNAGAAVFDVTRLKPVFDVAGLSEAGAAAGIIGRDYLKRCAALFDIDGDRMYLRPPRPAAPDTSAAKRDSTVSDDIISRIEQRIRARESGKQQPIE